MTIESTPTPGASQEVGENRQASQPDITTPDDADNRLENLLLSYEHNPESGFRRGYQQAATKVLQALGLTISPSMAASLYAWLEEVGEWRRSYEPSMDDWVCESRSVPLAELPPRVPMFSLDGTLMTSHIPKRASEG